MRATPSSPGFGPSESNQPRSPRVAQSRYVSMPSEEYRASVEPSPRVSSSGCGKTATNLKVSSISPPVLINDLGCYTGVSSDLRECHQINPVPQSVPH